MRIERLSRTGAEIYNWIRTNTTNFTTTTMRQQQQKQQRAHTCTHTHNRDGLVVVSSPSQSLKNRVSASYMLEKKGLL